MPFGYQVCTTLKIFCKTYCIIEHIHQPLKMADFFTEGIFDKIVFYIEDYRNPVGFEELLLWRKVK